MVKFSICLIIWIFTIFQLITPVAKTENYIVDTVVSPIRTNYDNYHNYHCNEYYQRRINSNIYLLNFTNIVRDCISVLLNGTCIYDSLSWHDRFKECNAIYTVNDIKELQKQSKHKNRYIPNPFRVRIIPTFGGNIINYYLNDTVVINNISIKSVKETKPNQKNRIDRKWRRRTLCAISDNENYLSDNLQKYDMLNDVDKTDSRIKNTLLDYDGPDLIRYNDDSDSLKAHVRVKRNKLEPDSISRLTYQQDYLKDLANSFPQDNYGSINENLYDDDSTFNAKREIKSQEYFLNDKSSDDSDQLNNNVYSPVTVPSCDEKSAGNSFVSAPPSAAMQNAMRNSNQKSENERVNRQESKDDISIVKGRSYDSLEERNMPDDPMLGVELVRRKRDDDRKLSMENNRDLSSVNKEKRSIFPPERSDSRSNPSSLIRANLKAELLRIRRKARANRREKSAKLKKKKKHSPKKHNAARNVQGSTKVVRSKNVGPSRVARERKKNEARKEGKSNVGIDRVVSKRNNVNNFRRRSEKAKKSIVRAEDENSAKNAATSQHVKVKRGIENGVLDDTKRSLVTKSFGIEKSPEVSGEYGNAIEPRMERMESSAEDKLSKDSVDRTITRSKRAKGSYHGFENEEEELRYYENIREPGTEMDQCRNQRENRIMVGNEGDGNRAVRSIEEVKELAKKLVTKVNELQNYLNVEESTGHVQKQRKIETRAIDDLCSNVSRGCDAFKETPKIVQKCVPSSRRDASTMKVIDRKADSSGITTDRKNSGKGVKKKSVEKKRSIGSRVRKLSPNGLKRTRKEDETKSNHKWGKWTDWSSCSVTCGKGRQIRWRYCLRDCGMAETEMEEKACQLPACPPGKFLGIF